MEIAVLGAAGFIGGHLTRRLLDEGHEVFAADIKKFSDWWQVHDDAMNYSECDLRQWKNCTSICGGMNQVYQLAARMGGAGYVFTGENDADIMHDSAMINLNIANVCREDTQRICWTSSACIYPAYNQEDPDNPNCAEDSAYPAMCDSEYGWAKLFSERLYQAYARNYGLDVRIARLHNCMGIHGSWNDGKEKAPAATCRKIAEAKDGDTVEIWGDGLQTRSFMDVDDCVEGLIRLMASDYREPLNLGREEMVSINGLFEMVADIAGKEVTFTHDLTKPQGVRGRNSDNSRLREVLNWEPKITLRESLEKTYPWIEEEVRKQRCKQ
jgi:nucleoside-diphosphate-sugar epimerase